MLGTHVDGQLNTEPKAAACLPTPKGVKALAQRTKEITAILDFVERNRSSYASLAVCRRAVDPDLEQVTPTTVGELRQRLNVAPDNEISAYYSIVM